MIQSTSISLPMTITKGESTSPDSIHDGRRVKLSGRMEAVCSGRLELVESPLPAPGTDSPPTSTTLRMPMMSSMIHSWKRSTMSAQVSWKVFSFSKRLKTLLLISTNWFEMSRVSSALEYELTATLRVVTW